MLPTSLAARSPIAAVPCPASPSQRALVEETETHGVHPAGSRTPLPRCPTGAPTAGCFGM